jgi:hypothetical protein
MGNEIHWANEVPPNSEDKPPRSKICLETQEWFSDSLPSGYHIAKPWYSQVHTPVSLIQVMSVSAGKRL